MVDEAVVTVTDLEKKHPDKLAYKGLYSIAKHIYPDDGEKLIKFNLRYSHSFSLLKF